MAKVKLMGLVHSVRGKVGDVIFRVNRGEQTVKKAQGKIKDLRTEKQVKVRELFLYFHKIWKEMSITERILWEEYTKYLQTIRGKGGGIISSHKGTKLRGREAFIGVNITLRTTGFKKIKKPPLGNISSPPPSKNDIRQYGTYTEKIKFNVWLPYSYTTQCKVQVWIRACTTGGMRYIAETLPITTSPAEVVINYVRFVYKGKTQNFPLSKLAPCDIKLQLRVVASNGKVSMPSALYIVEIRP